ncbi:hypothetical protein CISIN_1g042196mg [Citrus sinensis]|uniref:Uncharacterized protein n=1 Tax=Citrus sinensis TaxID=2711 RepID=A0A067EFM6_CITSI|nr:hypothetical protein CISIN_1g042196mg [Citrus sinensis]
MAEKKEPIYNPDLEGRPRRNLTKKKDLQRGASDQTKVMYNSYKVPVGKKRDNLRNYIRVIVRERVPIIYDDWRKVPLDIKETLWTHFQEKFKLSLKAKTEVFKWMRIALRGFRCKLANEYILPNANNLSSLKKPPLEYEGILEKRIGRALLIRFYLKTFSVKMEIYRRSPSKVTPKSVTNNPKATPKSVTNNPKATPKSVSNDPKATPKSVTKSYSKVND